MFPRFQTMEILAGQDIEHGVLFLPVRDRGPVNDFKQGSNVISVDLEISLWSSSGSRLEMK